jgi:hypothetical protein
MPIPMQFAESQMESAGISAKTAVDMPEMSFAQTLFYRGGK